MYKGHPTTSEMKHYTAEEFCADMDLQDEMTRIDTITVEVSLDEQLLADVMAYVKARGLTFQQLAETSIETLIREHGSLLNYKPDAPAAPTDDTEKKEES